MAVKTAQLNTFIMETTPKHLHTDVEVASNALSQTRRQGRFNSRPVCRKAAILMALAAATPVAVQVAHAGGYGSSDIAQREIARRAGLVKQADEALHLGRAAYEKKDYEEAVKQYQLALNLLPPGPALADRRHSYTGHLGDGAIALAQKYRRVGKYEEARRLLEDVLRRDPANFNAKKQLEYLDDPIRTNPALTYEHTQKVDRVRKHLYTGEGYYNLGDYDNAEAEFRRVLQVDRYNKAARRWLERVAATRSDYYRAAYDHTRAQLLSEVDRAWELTVPPELPTDVDPGLTPEGPGTGVERIRAKLNTITIPVVNFDNTTVEEALDFLRLRARELDPEGIGLNFIVRRPGGGGAAGGGGGAGLGLDDAPVASPGSIRIKELKLRNMPLGAVLQYICDATRLRYKLDDHAVTLLPLGNVEADDLYNRTFTVPPNFIAELLTNGDDDPGEGGGDDVFGDGEDAGPALVRRPPAKELLKRSGVSFPDGAFANHIPATSKLIVRNTLANLDIIEQIIEEMKKKGPRQVRIMTKFIEVSQENTDELGFDWVLGPIGKTANNFYVGGGTIGSGAPRVGSDFVANNGGLTSVPGVSTGTQPISNIATAGLRSGDYAVTRNSIDSVLNNPNRTAQSANVAPGILAFTGLFGDGQAQMIMRGLAQKKGTDVMTAPSVLARSGETATIEVIREFIYPTEYEPPELPNEVGTASGSGFGAAGGSSSTFPVTPATPTAFETRNTGVTLEIEPTISEDNLSIDLRFAPEIVEFEGFINYGSPIQSPAADAFGNPVQLIITENRIEMPVFSARRVKTALTIYDGYTVAIGGLMREDVQNVEDKVPVLGDLPIIGRLFQSKTENHIKSNLIIFVTAEIIDATGARIANRGGGIGAAAPTAPMPTSSPTAMPDSDSVLPGR